MSGILRLESLTKGNTLKQGDKTPLKYRLFDADGEKLNIAGKSAKVRLVYPDFLTIGYEKEGLTVAQDDTVTFTIDKVIPSRIYHIEIIVDDKFIFPSRADEAKFTIDKSSLDVEANIIEVVGVDAVVRKAVDLINDDPGLIIDENKLVNDIINNTEIGSINEYHQQFKDVMKELSEEKDYHSLPEISGARGGFDTLGERLNDTTAQLAHKRDLAVKIKGSDLDTSADADKVKLLNLSEEVHEVMAGTAPVISTVTDGSLTAEKYADGSVSEKKTSFLTPIATGRNLFNPNDSEKLIGQLLGADGSLSANASYDTSGYMLVSPSDLVYLTGISGGLGIYLRAYAFYDTSKVWLSGESTTSITQPLTAPLTARYLRVSYDKGITNYQIELNRKTPYEAYYEKNELSERIQPSKNTLGILRTIAGGKNLFDKDSPDIEIGHLNADGTMNYAQTPYRTTAFMECAENRNVYTSRLSGSNMLIRAYAFYDANKIWVSGASTTVLPSSFKTPFGIKYMKVSYVADNVDYQIEYDAVSAFENYVPKYVFNTGEVNLIDSLDAGEMPTDKLTISKKIINSRNLFNPSAESYLPGKILGADGTITANGGYNTTNLIACEQGDWFIASGLNYTYMLIRAYAFYDGLGNWLSGASQSSPVLKDYVNAPTNAKFFRLTFESATTNYQVEKGLTKTDYVPYSETDGLDQSELKVEADTSLVYNPWKGKTLIVNGDSIPFGTTRETAANPTGVYTDQIPWPVLVADKLNMVLKNYAIGGSTIAVKESAPTERTPIVTRYSSMDDGDVVMIGAITNDHYYDWTPLGDMTSRTNFTVYGALHNLCLGLLDKYSGKQILFVGPIKRGQQPQEYLNINGKTLKQYGEIVEEVCGYYGIPYFNMYDQCTINPHIEAQAIAYIPDTVHPNRPGHEIMANPIAGYLRQLA